jgi:hypothetical protein
LNDFKNAMTSSMSGVSRPSELDAGGVWLDTSLEGSPDYEWTLKIYDGTADITLFTINLTSGLVSAGSADSVFTINRTSADTVGPILDLFKARVINNGQVLNGDVIGQIDMGGAADDLSEPVAARIRGYASDNFTSTTNGAYLTFEVAADGTASLSEVMRVIDDKVGIGVTNPSSNLHVVGTSGVTSERRSADATSPKVILRKKRIATNGQVLSGDEVASLEVRSTDQNGADILAASISGAALENHTDVAQGTALSVKTIAAGSTSLTERLNIGETVESVAKHKLNALILDQQSVATSASITALSGSKTIVNFTGATATSLKGIDATAASKVVLLHNNSSAVVTVEHEDAGATATNRFDLPNSLDVSLQPDESLEVFYNTVSSRWCLKSGSGSGGGSLQVTGTRASPTNVVAGTSITISAVFSEQHQFVQGSGGHVVVSANPQITAGTTVGQRLYLTGRNDDQTLTYSNGTGLSLKQDTIVLYADTMLGLFWDGTNWVQMWLNQ